MRAADYDLHLAAESARFLELMSAADPGATVPSCPDWTGADLVWHLGQVQWFWGAIVGDRLTQPDAAEAIRPSRPDTYAGMLAFFATYTDNLQSVLASAPDTEPVWTWSQNRSVGFVRRRQAHEALIHRRDAELVVDQVTAFDAQLATDGIDEILTVMYGGESGWAMDPLDAEIGLVHATDTDSRWLVQVGTRRDDSLEIGAAADRRDLKVIERGTPNYTVSGTASDLDAWLWNRASHRTPDVVGDASALDTVIRRGPN